MHISKVKLLLLLKIDFLLLISETLCGSAIDPLLPTYYIDGKTEPPKSEVNVPRIHRLTCSFRTWIYTVAPESAMYIFL